MPFEIVRNDITKMEVDAIVNSANPNVFVGLGVDQAIHTAAGPDLFVERKSIGRIDVGCAVATPAFDLKAKHIIHTVGPEWIGGHNDEIASVKSCYQNSLTEALNLGCESIAFPLISTGTYGFPKEEALKIAIAVISEFVLQHDMMVYLVVYDQDSYKVSEKLFSDVTEFIDDHYMEDASEKDHFSANRVRYSLSYESLSEEQYQHKEQQNIEDEVSQTIGDLLDELEETFSQTLLRLIDESGHTDVDVYKKANIDRKLFSKIRSNINYKPSKITAIAFAIALELSLEQTKSFLASAGFALTHSSKFDIIIEFFIKEKNYNVFEINEILFFFNQALLGV